MARNKSEYKILDLNVKLERKGPFRVLGADGTKILKCTGYTV
jgi:hypothetical protein